MIDFKKQLLNVVEADDLQEQVPLSQHTTFHVGGPCSLFVTPQNEQQLQEVLKLCKASGQPWMLLGKGSNLLVSDRGYEGVMISLRRHFDTISLDESTHIMTVQAGAMMSAAAQAALNASLTGLEFAAGIPGTIGGGVFMNAGAYGGQLADLILDVRVLNTEGEILTVSKEDALFGYRSSLFQKAGMIILSCRMQLKEGDQTQILSTMKDLAGRRRDKQPLEFYSAGSTFKRPEGHFAGQLIESAGLKGYAVGDAEVSKKHAGFVINHGNATADQIYTLCQHVQQEVYRIHGVRLELEVIPIGNFDTSQPASITETTEK